MMYVPCGTSSRGHILYHVSSSHKTAAPDLKYHTSLCSRLCYCPFNTCECHVKLIIFAINSVSSCDFSPAELEKKQGFLTKLGWSQMESTNRRGRAQRKKNNKQKVLLHGATYWNYLLKRHSDYLTS